MKEGDENYYIYLASPNFKDNDKSLNFSRMPARIGRVTNKDYLEIFLEALSQKLIAIGPFDNQLTAEKSKYISRKYGESGSTGTENDGKVPDELKTMAENWKSIKIDITDVQFNEKKDFVSCKLNIIFAPKYFDENTVQFISFGYSNKDTTITFSDGITVQGQSFQDNNPVISFNDGGSVSYSATIPYSAGKDMSIVVNSILFSNMNILDCEDFLLEFKPE
jgi:hypothetical protein